MPAHASKNASNVPVKATSTAKVRVSVIIVNYNVKEFLEQALLSLGNALSDIASEIIVVDNASVDGSVQLISERFPDVRLIANKQNLGFAKSSNQGLEIAGEYVALLNPDTIVQEDTFSKMLDFFADNPNTGMLGCKILNPDGSLQLACRRSFPTPWIAFCKLSGLSFIFPKSRLFGRYNLTYLDADETSDVEAISGSFMMVRSEVIKRVGLLDGAFFMYGEDLDWCFRIGQDGWKVTYYPGTQIIHFKGESSKRARFDNLRTFYHAMELFAEKHFKERYMLMPFWLLRLAIWFRAGVSLVGRIFGAAAGLLFDALLFVLSLTTSFYLRFGSFESLERFAPVAGAYTIIWLLTFKLFGCYNRYKMSVTQAAFAVAAGFLINSSLTFFFKQYAFSRAVVLIAGLFSMIAIPGWRLLIKLVTDSPWLRLGNGPGRNTIIVGDIKSGEELIRKLRNQIASPYQISGLVSTNGEYTGEIVSDVKVMGQIDELEEIIEQLRAEEVVFSTSELSYDQILSVIARSGNKGVNFKLSPGNLDVVIGKASIDRIDDIPLFDIDDKLHQSYYRWMKRVFDIVVAIFTLTLTAPFYLLKLLTLNKPDDAEEIHGSNGNKVKLYKFGGNKWHDKLPYLLSVLRGDLTFVGDEIVRLGSGHERPVYSHAELKPGLTGIIQINRNKLLTAEDKRKYHLYYLKNYSPMLDLEILLKAVIQK